MIVDDNNLDLIINDLQTKLTTNSQKREEIIKNLDSARSIRLIEEPVPTDEDPDNIIKILPQDPELEITITEERRNEIYDKVVSDVAQI